MSRACAFLCRQLGSLAAIHARRAARGKGDSPVRSVCRRVEFLIDGRVRWTATTPPYAFGLSDGDIAKRLFPSLLGQGSHNLAVRVITNGGKAASSSARITVANTAPAPTPLLGTFTRKVTAADVRRTQPFRHEPAGDEALPSGTWRLHVAHNGLISFDDPSGSGGNETFTAPPRGTLTLEGPANYLNPPDRQGSFCGVEPNGAYRWTAHGSTITLTPLDDSCADRNSLFAGTWTRG